MEQRTQAIGRELLTATRQAAGGALTRAFWSDRLIGWALQDEGFKTQLFRFVDVFPVLKTPEAIHQHLTEYLQQPGVKLPPGLGLGLKAGGLLKGTLARTMTSQIEAMAGNFIAGRDLAAALPLLEARWREGIAFSVDLLGEACVSQAEAEVYQRRYLELVEQLPAAVLNWPANPVLESDHLGPIPRANLSIKISALDGHVSPVDGEGSVERLVSALAPLLTRAKEKNVLVNFDMEHHALKDLTIRLFKRCCELFDFPAGLAMQAYLRSADADVADLIAWAKATRRVATVRLIKGAYWDYETIHAQMMGWEPPVWSRKVETDACFERLTQMLLRESSRRAGDAGLTLALGTHNVRSVAHAMACVEAEGLARSAVEFQALRGMADDLKTVLLARGWRVREYLPIGEMIPGMAYLVRRLLENTSNEGWLRAGHAAKVSDEELLRAPVVGEDARSKEQGETGFVNEPTRDFAEPEVRESFATAIRNAKVPAVTQRTVEEARAAVGMAELAFPAWRDRTQTERSALVRAAAERLRARRDELAGIIIRASAKTWAEADADVCEAIDFCEFYAREALALFEPQRLGRFIGEHNEEYRQPRGVAVVISPWNFPLAICTGMTVAALVTGNTVVVKPAEQTPAVAQIICEALWAAGVPREVLHFVPGVGETVGAALVRDPRIAIIAFTGSAAVGREIVRAAGDAPPEQRIVKHVICEMGGKNAIIVDDSADLDEAVLGVRQSAFSYAGQKCSACSRVIVLDAVHDPFVARLIESARALVLGDPLSPGTDIGPVIDDAAAQKIRQYVDIGKQEGALAYPDLTAIKNQNSKIENRLLGPHIFTGVLPGARLAQEEIFGPVMAVLKARDFDHALDIANGTAYKLTGGLFSRTPSHLDAARRRFRVGNLYINRGITGALVSRQPFGGFGLSGTGPKAGGRDYLLAFTDARLVTENTMRRGFSPME